MTSKEDIMKKVFIGGINRATSEERLKELFGQYGQISDLVIITDKNTGNSRGFGYVTYQTEASVEDVLEWDEGAGALKTTYELDGKKLDVKRAIPREKNDSGAHAAVNKLFMGGLSQDVTEEDIRQFLEKSHENSKCGKIGKIDIKTDRETGRNKGFAFVEVSSPHMADRISVMDETFSLKGKNGTLKKAEPQGGAGGERGRGRGGGRGASRGGPRGGASGGGRGGYSSANSTGGYSQGGYGGQSTYGGASAGYGQAAYGAAGGGGGGAYGSYGQGYGGYDAAASTTYPQSYSRDPPAGGRGGGRFGGY